MVCRQDAYKVAAHPRDDAVCHRCVASGQLIRPLQVNDWIAFRVNETNVYTAYLNDRPL
ncbi:hypothetical protein AS9A_1800 [Hoyosella subflava DQS3-9A1]|uniref:Uncharacterized protein n=1 Tax=Hoyosella subflava (strain DSM 45089 / JCM 17490 / NBRC 109087 / DQS3-9A1) TaxID=443218 RepID=F6ELJ9_HOYSD|nr:hypothetical protein AS9A_1800 [Hoyosella subflava DQS3-9A1]